MKLKILHLNIRYGVYLEDIIKFAKKENFDVLSLQEVANKISRFKGQPECFNTLKKSLKLDGELGMSWRDIHDKDSYFGNALLWKPKFKKLSGKVIQLKKFKIIDSDALKFQDYPSCAVSATLEINNTPTTFISAHLAWGPNPKDRKYKLKPNRKLYEYVKTLKNPFILTGDFNLTPDSKVVSWFNQIAQNPIAKNKIANTLNPRTHRVSNLFPKGLAVDYIFVSNDLKIKSFKVIDDLDLSDHFGLVAEIEI